ncbi:MAG TPA: glycosyl hydrolase family 65 protein [Solirubrobacteraceae bacterium]|nr:glycosyl hydrolase family 65 protein [Solirubrobacteraceae bacterium]
MRSLIRLLAVAGALSLFASAAQQAQGAAPAGAGSFLLTANSPGGTYAPTFTGNGMLGVRVPPSGQGYAAGTVPAQSELAGFYGQVSNDPKPANNVQQRANIPTWSTLTFAENGNTFTVPGPGVSNWRQSIDLHTGIVATTASWTAPDGHVTDLSYEVLTDRANPSVGLVRLQITPHWSGVATVTDAIDGTADTTATPELTSQVAKGWNVAARQDWVAIATKGTGIQATLASQLQVSSNILPTTTQTDQTTDQSVGQELGFPVQSGQTYTITKYVGVESSQNAADSLTAAQAQAAGAAATGWDSLLGANQASWASLWNGSIEVRGNRTLATDVNASEFYLWSSTRDGVDWSVSPAGLSSNGYDGHIFWDAETWMYPSLLAQHPDLAAGMNAYRFGRLSEAEQHATATGYAGARFPWESALDGTEQIPPPTSINSEGLYEQHITADIALAQWQYYLVTGDKAWLQQQGWPVLSEAADFWASRATLGSDGKYHINGVTGPDEENPNVNDEVYTNVGAMRTLQDATAAAQVLGISAPASWTQIAANLVVPVNHALNMHPEFSGYGNQLVKQADVTLLQYPWNYTMPAKLAEGDINFYVPRTDPGGPSMSDAVNLIDNAAQGTAGCASYVYTERSYQPFIRDVFHQFSETRTGGAFTFMTGIGGFLQEFLYGYSGMRWNPNNVQLNPSLNSQIGGIVLHNLQWRGRTFTVTIGQQHTVVRLTSGAPFQIKTPAGTRLLTRGHPLTLITRRPDLTASSDLVRCGHVVASSSQPGAPALAAIDGSPATDWEPARVHATLTAPVQGLAGTIRTITLRWGRQWPAAPGPNIPPPPGPVTVLRPASYSVFVSNNGRTWRRVAFVRGHAGRVLDTIHLKGAKARFVRLRLTAPGAKKLPMLDELTVSR